MAVGKSNALTQTAEEVGLDEWLRANSEKVARADELLAARLSEPRFLGEHTRADLCEKILGILRQALGDSGASGGSSSVLLLGEKGSGKTHAVEWCIEKLRESHEQSLVVLRAFGMNYATDVECVRHLATQIAGQLPDAPRANASFEQTMDWLRKVLNNRFQCASDVVIVLDKFEHFCSRARQTLLYNLFDIAQERSVRLSIIGMSDQMDVMSKLEKRIKSRFSMRCLHAHLPTTMDELVRVLMSKLQLPADCCELDAPFRNELSRLTEAALKCRARQWQRHLELGRPPAWFLWQCIPLAALLRSSVPASTSSESLDKEASTPPRPAKRARRLLDLGSETPGCLPAASSEEARALLLSKLSETEHIVLLALFRLKDRQAVATLARLLHEIRLLHETGGLVAHFAEDRYCAAFDSLVETKLVELSGHGSVDTPERYLTCCSRAHHIYSLFVIDLESGHSTQSACGKNALPWNPLRSLPQRVQQWSVRHRH